MLNSSDGRAPSGQQPFPISGPEPRLWGTLIGLSGLFKQIQNKKEEEDMRIGGRCLVGVGEVDGGYDQNMLFT